QRPPRHVDALPEAARAEQDRVAGLAEALEELMPRPAALDEHRPRRIAKVDALTREVERTIAREEQESAAARCGHERPDDLHQRVDEVAARRRRQPLR